jgi:deazaflavin-dependent oxidoreductase (nitroreductase family)
MEQHIADALKQGGVVDITTIGRTTGLPRRIEIYFHHFDGEYFITGRPGRRRRDWLANMVAKPDFTLHLKRDVSADLPATAVEISDPDARARILFRILTESWDTAPEQAQTDLPAWVEGAPLIQFSLA